ncbi:MAG: tripartite tricarboxylate transporter substrate binding protein [Burkholderiales bacterium]|nr:tripartite tricarboxylate transporter substrate binding protein [Burkholderiales bacterium]
MPKLIRAAAAALLCLACSAWAQYPDRPITLIVPYSAGGATDIAGRNLAHYAGLILNQRIVVTNRPGAAGAIGSQLVRNAAPDGYTLLIARVGAQAVLPALDSSTPFKWNDFSFLSVLDLTPTICVARTQEPYSTLPALIDYLRKNPGKLNYSSSGEGTLPHMAAQLLFQLGKLKSDVAVNVPYKSDQDTVLAMLSGQVNFHCASATALMEQIKTGRLRALAVATAQRMPELPDVPTAREQGFGDMEKIVGWSALYGPPGLPAHVVDKWTEVMKKLATDPGWVEGNAKFGGIGSVRSPEKTEEFAREQFNLYFDLAKSLGIRR